MDTKALKNNDLIVDESLIFKIEDIDNFEPQIEELLKTKEINAVFAVNEMFAVTTIKLAIN
jgi:LacI family transcriptional regulator